MDKLPDKGDAPDLRVFTVYHDDEQISRFGLKETDVDKLFAVHKPIEGDNINTLNLMFSEMVAMYWVWKNNVRSEWVGFQHYHDNLFDGVKNVLSCKETCVVGPMFETVMADQYRHVFKNCSWDVFEQVLSEIYGNDNKYTRHLHENHNFYRCCSFVMPWDKFVSMCEEMFKVSEMICDKLGFGYDAWKYLAMTNGMARNRNFPYVELQDRFMAHLLERFISAWISLHFNGILILHRA